ncbi:hypothetical protein [Patulibacter defluvii]|uniref:hypothetical protein n=1 Tax=Patulibacter defluvii TaxID=3095358 RepID=UPI002A75E12C|nr:hypothetical protein [Patulibacter sp. DM4]
MIRIGLLLLVAGVLLVVVGLALGPSEFGFEGAYFDESVGQSFEVGGSYFPPSRWTVLDLRYGRFWAGAGTVLVLAGGVSAVIGARSRRRHLARSAYDGRRRTVRIGLALLAAGVLLVAVGLIVGPTLPDFAFFDRSIGEDAYAGVFGVARPPRLDVLVPGHGPFWAGAGPALMVVGAAVAGAGRLRLRWSLPQRRNPR